MMHIQVIWAGRTRLRPPAGRALAAVVSEGEGGAGQAKHLHDKVPRFVNGLESEMEGKRPYHWRRQ
jgi:hypothetical protein